MARLTDITTEHSLELTIMYREFRSCLRRPFGIGFPAWRGAFGPPLLFRGNRRVRGSLLDYGMGGGVIIYIMIYEVILSVLTNSERPLFAGRQMIVTSCRAHGTADGVTHRWALYLGCSVASVIAAWMYLILPFSDRVLRPLSRPKYPVGLAIRSLSAPSTESRR